MVGKWWTHSQSYTFAQMKVQGELTVLPLPPLLSMVQAGRGGGGGCADPQCPHKELWTIKKVDSFYTDLPLCSVWGLILVPESSVGAREIDVVC